MRRIASTLVLISCLAGAPVASASPMLITKSDRPEKGEFNDDKWRARIDSLNRIHNDERIAEYSIKSPSMLGREIPVVVLKAKDPNRPVIYLLNGAGGGEQSVSWVTHTEALDFYWKKNVNVVIPMRGAFTYYVDWVRDAQGTEYAKGPQKWETFLTKELPSEIEPEIQADPNNRGIVGMSMSATSSLLLAERNEDFYNVVGSYSGCAATSKAFPSLFANFTMERDGETPESIWGPLGSDTNIEHDALIQAEGLRGKTIYVSNGSGLISDREFYDNIKIKGEKWIETLASSSEVTVVGGIIEAATNACTHDLKAKLNQLDIPATFKFRNTGVHTWYYWEKDMKDSWPVYAKGFGIDAEDDEPTTAGAKVPLKVKDNLPFEDPSQTEENSQKD
ncbi:MAG: alpha/beta hydrolase family protein [Corynebacterium sp.]|uniref:alpha/beta hydrolase n=1 Tax=Corynebacterium sp. TaxID=1720 RepID=UPI0026DD56E2|nr:alpha/beta hydrolase family protein [Corynebacterium sp.]MDO4760535.1 alpha/beta hydrolase family protein [Corynebacterium sp.]